AAGSMRRPGTARSQARSGRRSAGGRACATGPTIREPRGRRPGCGLLVAVAWLAAFSARRLLRLARLCRTGGGRRLHALVVALVTGRRVADLLGVVGVPVRG